MPIFGSAARGLANKILAISGQVLTISSRTQASAYSPATGVTITPTNTTAMGVIVPYESFRHMGFHKDIGLDVVQGDMVAIISAVGTDGNPIAAPAPNWRISAGGKTYSITAIAPHSPAGVDLIYLCSLRGGQ